MHSRFYLSPVAGKLFGPGTPTSDLVDYIRAWFAEREGAPTGTSGR